MESSLRALVVSQSCPQAVFLNVYASPVQCLVLLFPVADEAPSIRSLKYCVPKLKCYLTCRTRGSKVTLIRR